MKTILSVIFLLISTVINATNYYMSATGSDSADGLTPSTPWRTIKKVNAEFSSFVAGDSILFKRGDIFYGSILVNTYGELGHPIIISAYVKGDDPVITGFKEVTDWTYMGDNIWESKNNVSTLSYAQIVTIEDKNIPMGRWPNNKWIYPRNTTGYPDHYRVCYEDSLDASVLDWTGGELVLRNLRWVFSRNPISDHHDSTIVYTPVTSHHPYWGVGFFIQNNINTLDSINEWYYNTTSKKLSIYNIAEPTNVKISTVETLLDIEGEFITVDNLSFKGANTNAIYLANVSHITIQNCDIDFTFNAISSTSGNHSSHIIIQNNTINHTNNNAITLANVYRNSLISDNVIKNTGVLIGMGQSDIHNYVAINIPNLRNSIIQYNEIDSVGYNGIDAVDGDSVIITRNFINHYCEKLDDGGGIYIHSACTYKTVSRNIILNGRGQYWTEGNYFPSTGQLAYGAHQAFGIYLDNVGGTNNIEVLENSIYNARYAGIFWGTANHIRVIGNTICFCKRGILMHKEPNDTSTINVAHNIFLNRYSNIQLFAKRRKTIFTNMSIDNNYYAYYAGGLWGSRMIYPDSSQIYIPPIATYLTLEQWQIYSSGKDTSSTVTNIGDINYAIFYYNASKKNRIVTLQSPMKDLRGIKYYKNIILYPYTSTILMAD